MSKIKIDTSQIYNESTVLKKKAQELGQLSRRLQTILNGFDIKTSHAEELREALRDLNKQTMRQQQWCADMSKNLSMVNDEFISTDDRLAERGKGINYLLDFAGWLGSTMIGGVPALIMKNMHQVADIFCKNQTTNFSVPYAMDAIQDFFDKQGNKAVLSEGQEIEQYLSKNDYSLLFGRYDYVIRFIHDLNWYDEIMYGLRSWKETAAALFQGGFAAEASAQAFMNNPDECKAFLRGVIDEMAGTEYLNVLSSDQEDALGAIKNIAKHCGFGETADFIDMLNGYIGDAEAVDKVLKDYSNNISMLESLKTVAPSGTFLSGLVDDLINEYQDQARTMFMDDLKSKAEDNALDIASYVLGGNFAGVDAVIQTVLGDVKELDAIDTVIYSNEVRSNAIKTFRNAADVIASGSYTDEDVTAYKTAFNVVRTMTIEQYEAMHSYYDSGSKEALFLKDQLIQLKNMEYDNFIYADDYNSFNPSAYGGSSGGGVR